MKPPPTLEYFQCFLLLLILVATQYPAQARVVYGPTPEATTVTRHTARHTTPAPQDDAWVVGLVVFGVLVICIGLVVLGIVLKLTALWIIGAALVAFWLGIVLFVWLSLTINHNRRMKERFRTLENNEG